MNFARIRSVVKYVFPRRGRARTRAIYLCALLALQVLVIPMTGPAFSQETNDAAGTQGWERVRFDFGSPALNFSALVPQGTQVKTGPMPPPRPGSAGEIGIIGKVLPGDETPPVELTVVGYNLPDPVSPLRLCSFEAKLAGYTPRLSNTAADLTEAELVATKKTEDGAPLGADFSFCAARGHKALVLHFVVDMGGARTRAEADALTQHTQAYALDVIRSLRFANGQQSNFGPDLQTIPLRIGDSRMSLKIPSDWQVPINDFHGPLPAELHLVRSRHGKDVGLIWLSDWASKTRPDLEGVGPGIVKAYFAKQAPDAQPLALVSSEPDEKLAQGGGAARRFRFAVTDGDGVDAGEIEATLVWRKGVLSVLTVWTPWRADGKRMTFMSRLPALTVYDIVRQEVLALPRERAGPKDR